MKLTTAEGRTLDLTAITRGDGLARFLRHSTLTLSDVASSIAPTTDFAKVQKKGDDDYIISGIALPMDEWTERIPGLLMLKFAKDCMDESLKDSDYRVFEGHNSSNLLARRSANTAYAARSGSKLNYEANIGDPNRDVLVERLTYRIERKELTGISVGVIINEVIATYDSKSDMYWVEITGAEHIEYSLVSMPQFEGTTIAPQDAELPTVGLEREQEERREDEELEEAPNEEAEDTDDEFAVRLRTMEMDMDIAGIRR